MTDFLVRKDFNSFGTTLEALDAVHKKIVPSNERLDNLIDVGIKHGVLSGIAVGAGGGGFIIFMCPNTRVKKSRMPLLVIILWSTPFALPNTAVKLFSPPKSSRKKQKQRSDFYKKNPPAVV